MFDEDGSGDIEIDELKEMFRVQGVSNEVWKQMVKEVDQNGDGMIDYKEFKHIMTEFKDSGKNSNPFFEFTGIKILMTEFNTKNLNVTDWKG